MADGFMIPRNSFGQNFAQQFQRPVGQPGQVPTSFNNDPTAGPQPPRFLGGPMLGGPPILGQPPIQPQPPIMPPYGGPGVQPMPGSEGQPPQMPPNAYAQFLQQRRPMMMQQ